ARSTPPRAPPTWLQRSGRGEPSTPWWGIGLRTSLPPDPSRLHPPGGGSDTSPGLPAHRGGGSRSATGCRRDLAARSEPRGLRRTRSERVDVHLQTVGVDLDLLLRDVLAALDRGLDAVLHIRRRHDDQATRAGVEEFA